MGIISDLIPDIDSILGVRDDLGAALAPVYIVTRTWSGSELGDGTMTETRARILPTPRVTQLQKDLKIGPGGAMESARIELRMISKNKYSATDLNFKNLTGSTEKFYEINGEKFRPVAIRERHVCWNVTLIREAT